MAERQLNPGNKEARAYRNCAEKVQAYAAAMHIDPFDAANWEWKTDGKGAFQGVPTMVQIEHYYTEHIACLTCKGLKFIALPLDDLRQHGTKLCPDCKGSGHREFD